MKLKFRNLVVTILLMMFFPSTAFAHSGRTDAYGCHNCYTSYCYGEYHCHGGGSYVAPAAPRYLLPAPTNPSSGNWDYEISSDNWCNYDLKMTWDKPTYGDRFSIAPSKTAGADPGPLVDTSSLNYTFDNLTPGKWYVNIKTGNSERWSAISYWTVDLPKPTPSLTARLEKSGNSQYLVYEISCLDKVEGPNEFIDHLKSNNNKPKGRVLLPYTYPTTITVKGWDKAGKEYSHNLSYSPITPTPKPTSKSSDNSDGDGLTVLAITGGSIWGGAWLYGKAKSALSKSDKKAK